MPKATDITGTFRVPQEAWGSFWNFMLTLDGAEITPITRVRVAATKRANGSTKDGSTSRCIVLRALTKAPAARPALSELLVAAGKNATTIGSTLMDAKKAKLVKLTGRGRTAVWTITAAGRAFLKSNCTGEG